MTAEHSCAIIPLLTNFKPICVRWAVGAAGARLVDNEEVSGSNPLPPTILFARLVVNEEVFPLLRVIVEQRQALLQLFANRDVLWAVQLTLTTIQAGVRFLALHPLRADSVIVLSRIVF